jgi:hypothetical protein
MVRIFVTEEAFEAIKATMPVGTVALMARIPPERNPRIAPLR